MYITSVLFDKGHGFDADAVAMAGNDDVTHCAAYVAGWVLDATHGKVVRKMRYENWKLEHSESFHVPIYGAEVKKCLEVYRRLEGKKYDFGGVKWHIFKPFIFYFVKKGWVSVENPDQYHCVETVLEVFSHCGFFCHVDRSKHYMIHASEVLSALNEGNRITLLKRALT